jgi:hypothetical protein
VAEIRIKGASLSLHATCVLRTVQDVNMPLDAALMDTKAAHAATTLSDI